ncbi:ABC transporter permease [Salmonella enterica]|nr:ABC transporter permease [Salmonella enterica]
MNDLKEAITRYPLWIALGWNDVLGRYRRSVLGPFWLTISMGVTITAMGPLYGSLFGSGAGNYIMHLTTGMIFWAFLSSTVNDCCSVFNDSASVIKQSDLPFHLYILRVFYRQLTIMAHNCIIIPPVMLLTGATVSAGLFLLVPALILTAATLVSAGMMLAIFCTRYRDMGPVVQSVITLYFFITPVIWAPTQLPAARREFVDYNIFYYYMEILRKPLTGAVPDMHIWSPVIITTLTTLVISQFVLNKYKTRIVYWL